MRQTGRTFRSILRALQHASAGETVIFLADSFATARSAFNLTLGILQVSDTLARANEAEMSLYVYGGGFVKFIGSHYKSAGIPTVIKDHE